MKFLHSAHASLSARCVRPAVSAARPGQPVTRQAGVATLPRPASPGRAARHRAVRVQRLQRATGAAESGGKLERVCVRAVACLPGSDGASGGRAGGPCPGRGPPCSQGSGTGWGLRPRALSRRPVLWGSATAGGVASAQAGVLMQPGGVRCTGPALARALQQQRRQLPVQLHALRVSAEVEGTSFCSLGVRGVAGEAGAHIPTG